MLTQFFVPDVRTVIVTSFFIYATDGLFLALLYRIKRRRAFLHLSLGCFAFSAGFALYFARGWLGVTLLTGPLANVLIALYPILLLTTLMEFFGAGNPRRAVLWSLPPMAVLAWFTTVYRADPFVPVLAASAVNGLLYLASSVFLLRHVRHKDPGTLITTVTNVILAVVLFGRAGLAAWGAFGHPGANAMPEIAVALSYTLLVALFSLSAQMFGLPLLEFTRAETELTRMASTDPLTEVLNRRSFFVRAGRALEECRQTGRAATLLMLDLDHFKRINDTHGHPAGDAVLRAAASLLRQALRHDDVLGRLGGEEFAILLPGTQAAHAFEIAERIRAACEAACFGECGSLRVTVSIGLAGLEGENDLAELIRAADHALYAAKEGGRNRVTMAGPVAA